MLNVVPCARLAVDRDVPAALPDDPVDGREAEAGPLARLLRREERLEDAAGDPLRPCPMPVSVTESIDVPPAPRCGAPAYALVESTAFVSIVSVPPSGMASRALTARFRMTCSTWTGSARTCGGPAPGRRRHARCPRRSAARSILVMPATTSLRSTPCGWSTCLRLKASSCRVSAGGALAAGCRISSSVLADAASLPGAARAASSAVPDDRGQEVVEVVRDPARQAADRLHLLGLNELFLELLLLGDVPQEAERHVHPLPHRGDHGGLDPDGFPGGRHRAELIPGGDLLAAHPPDVVALYPFPVLRMDDLQEGGAHHIFLPDPYDLASRRGSRTGRARHG